MVNIYHLSDMRSLVLLQIAEIESLWARHLVITLPSPPDLSQCAQYPDNLTPPWIKDTFKIQDTRAQNVDNVELSYMGNYILSIPAPRT